MNEAWFALLLAVVACLYASVGHGGASAYIALMTLAGYGPEIVRPAALLLNLCVSAVAFLQFNHAGHFRWGMFWPFAVASVPCAWLGARIEPDTILYKRILALCLLASVARLFGMTGAAGARAPFPPVGVALLIGALLGFISGIIGIGGGILLSPLLLVLGWSSAKEGAAISSAFIFVNSVAGLAGLSGRVPPIEGAHVLWACVAIGGGWLGACIGARHLTPVRLQQVLGSVLLLASFKLAFA